MDNNINNLIGLYSKLFDCYFKKYQLELLKDLNSLELIEQLKSAINIIKSKIELMDNLNIKFNTNIITENYTNTICKAYYEEDNKFYYAKILAVDFLKQEIKVKYIGYTKEVRILKSIFIYTDDNTINYKDLHEGEYLYLNKNSVKYEYCTVISIINKNNIKIKLKNGNILNTKLFYLKKIDLKEEDKSAKKFIIPDKYKLASTDTEEERIRKRKIVKSLKRKQKPDELKNYYIEEKDKWNKFKKFKNNKKY